MLNPTSFLVKRSVCVFWGCETVHYLLPPTPPTFLVPRQKTVIIMFRQFDQSWTQSAESRFRCLNSLWGELDRNVIVVTAGKLVGIMMCVCGECRESDANTMCITVRWYIRKCLKNNDCYSQTFLLYFHLSWSGRLYLAFVSICKDIIHLHWVHLQ